MPSIVYEVTVEMRNGTVYLSRELTCQVSAVGSREEIHQQLSDGVWSSWGESIREIKVFDLGTGVRVLSPEGHYGAGGIRGRVGVNPNEIGMIEVDILSWSDDAPTG